MQQRVPMRSSYEEIPREVNLIPATVPGQASVFSRLSGRVLIEKEDT